MTSSTTGWLDGWMAGWLDGWMAGWPDGRMAEMVASTAAFGANRNVDTVPTSHYVLRAAFEPAAMLQP